MSKHTAYVKAATTGEATRAAFGLDSYAVRRSDSTHRVTVEWLEPEEEPEVWEWYDNKWKVCPSDEMVPHIRLYPIGFEVRVYGTTADRDQKRDDLIAAARKAGKP